MRRPFSILCLTAAWLCANGVVLDAVQVYAWTRMFTGYMHTTSIERAAAETFDPGKPCPICVVVQKARDSGPKQPATAPVPAARLTLACQGAEKMLIGPQEREWLEQPASLAPARRELVPLPPPKTRLA